MEKSESCTIPVQREVLANESGTSMVVNLGDGLEMRAVRGVTDDEMRIELYGKDGSVIAVGAVPSLIECRQWIRDHVRFNGMLPAMSPDLDREGRLAGYIAGHILVEGKVDFVLTPSVLEEHVRRFFPAQLITGGNKWVPSFCPICGATLGAGLGRLLDDMARCEPCGLSLDVVGLENGLKIVAIPLHVFFQHMGERYGEVVN